MSFKEIPLMKMNEGTVLFHPYISKNSFKNVKKVLSGRWIGQGPLVDKFESKFQSMFGKKNHCLSTGSGTDALHLSYILSGLKRGDEVIAPLFTCTATNIPFLYMGVKIKFADIDPQTMNISVQSVKKLITKKTKAIVCMHYGGLPCDLDELQKISNKYKIPLIEDAAHALGATFKGKPIGSISDFTMFSFQAIKHITTADGGMLCIKNKKLINKAKRIRWFGIDREKKQKATWENDIYEVGYKYQMTDLGASVGLEGLKDFKKILNHRKTIFSIYLEKLEKNKNIQCVHKRDGKRTHAAWLFTIISRKKDLIQKKLREKRVETNQVHFRNDKYSIFKNFVKGKKYPNMDYAENKYLAIPVHHKVSIQKAKYIADLINKIV
jgi:dTDP-4-amino-4,6-dideoxygalactose transaminase